MLNSELNLNTFCVRDESGNCNVEATAAKFSAFLTEYATSVKADNETISVLIDSVYDAPGNKGKKNLPFQYVLNQTVGKLDSDGTPESFKMVVERVTAYIKESGRFESTKGPNGGLARKVSEPAKSETEAA